VPDTAAFIESLFRRESGWMSVRTRILGPQNLELAEDVLQEAFVAAMPRVVGARRARRGIRLHDCILSLELHRSRRLLN
jgi:hypothetical protein